MERNVTGHKGSKRNEGVEVTAVGAGGGKHRYRVLYPSEKGGSNCRISTEIKFHDPAEAQGAARGQINGVTDEAVLAVLIDRHADSADIVGHLKKALAAVAAKGGE